MALTYCSGRNRRAEDVFGWRRQAVQLGLHEKRTGIVCLGLYPLCCGAELCVCPSEAGRRPEISSAMISTPGGSAQLQRVLLASPTSRPRLITDPKGMAGARNSSNAWSSSLITSASSLAPSTIRRTTASTIRGSFGEGSLEEHWNGAKLHDCPNDVGVGQEHDLKRVHPVVEQSRTVYEKGVTAARVAIPAVESRLEQNALLPTSGTS